MGGGGKEEVQTVWKVKRDVEACGRNVGKWRSRGGGWQMVVRWVLSEEGEGEEWIW